jgi:hypothetical protein
MEYKQIVNQLAGQALRGLDFADIINNVMKMNNRKKIEVLLKARRHLIDGDYRFICTSVKAVLLNDSGIRVSLTDVGIKFFPELSAYVPIKPHEKLTGLEVRLNIIDTIIDMILFEDNVKLMSIKK